MQNTQYPTQKEEQKKIKATKILAGKLFVAPIISLHLDVIHISDRT